MSEHRDLYPQGHGQMPATLKSSCLIQQLLLASSLLPYAAEKHMAYIGDSLRGTILGVPVYPL